MKIIAFDFDGTLHTDTVTINEKVVENCNSKPLPKNKKHYNIFPLNIHKIKKYNKFGYHIYLVTARPDKNDVEKLLRNIGINENIIPYENIYANQNNKINRLVKIKADEFYDDCPINILKVQRGRHKLKNTFHLFYSIPEKNINIEIPSQLNLYGKNKEALQKLHNFKEEYLSSLRNKKTTRKKNILRKNKTNKKR
jgi:hydroxymethylpyrimidine pyrophosphatase-like HAD family hydrolase